ncbi:hypothetical protein [Dolichospermum sp. UHCC 0684]
MLGSLADKSSLWEEYGVDLWLLPISTEPAIREASTLLPTAEMKFLVAL